MNKFKINKLFYIIKLNIIKSIFFYLNAFRNLTWFNLFYNSYYFGIVDNINTLTENSNFITMSLSKIE